MNTSSDCDKSSCSTTKGNLSSYSVVQSAVRDVFRIQQDALRQIRGVAEKQRLNHVLKIDFEKCKNELEQEKINHSKTKIELVKSNEKVEFLTEENEILKQQLKKERTAHENTAKALHAKSYRESTRTDFLHQKCLEAKEILDKQQNEIEEKQTEIELLKQKLKIQQNTHKQTLEDIDLSKMQQNYFAKSLK